MKKKLLILMSALGFVIWCGVTIAKTVIAYDIFEPFSVDLVLKSAYTPEMLFRSVYLYSSLSLYTIVGYISFLMFATIYIITERKNLKLKAWLFMIAVLIVLGLPFSIYQIYCNIILSSNIFWGGLKDFNSTIINDYFLKLLREPKFSVVSSITFLVNITVLIVAIMKPLHRETPYKTDDDDVNEELTLEYRSDDDHN